MDEPLVCQLSRPRYSVAFSAKGKRWVALPRLRGVVRTGITAESI